MRGIWSSRRTLAATATGSITLCLVILAACGSSAPVVSIAALATLDDGTTVQTIGLIAELWAWDDGTENILLVETSSCSTVVVVCSPAIHAQPSAYVDIGDELKVVGEVFGRYYPRKLYSDSDRVALLLPCEFVMTVDALATCWRLFEGDEVRVRGILLAAEGESEFALRGMSGASAVSLDCACEILPTLLGRDVLVSGRLLFEESSLRVVLHADSVVAC